MKPKHLIKVIKYERPKFEIQILELWIQRGKIFIKTLFKMFQVFLTDVTGQYKIQSSKLSCFSPIANCANISSLLYNRLRTAYTTDATNWVGFYFRSSANTLQLGPFCGLPACQKLKFSKKGFQTGFQRGSHHWEILE